MEFESINHAFITLSLCVPRMAGAFLVSPFLSSTLVPGLVRNSIILSWSLMVFPIVAPAAAAPEVADVTLALLIVKETFIGFLIGFSVSFVVWAIQAAGFFIDNQRGAAMAGSVDPLAGTQTSPLGNLFVQFVVVYAYISGAVLVFVAGIYKSYVLWPVTSFVPAFTDRFPVLMLGQLDWLMKVALVLSGPIIMAMFLAEIGLALISRFAPQLQVFFLAMPIKSAIAMFMLVLYGHFMLDFIKDYLGDSEGVLQLLGGALQ